MCGRWWLVITLQAPGVQRKRAKKKKKNLILSRVALQVPSLPPLVRPVAFYSISPTAGGEDCPLWTTPQIYVVIIGNGTWRGELTRVVRSSLECCVKFTEAPLPLLFSVTPFICAIYAVTGSVCLPLILPLKFPISPACSADAAHLSGNAAICFLGSS